MLEIVIVTVMFWQSNIDLTLSAMMLMEYKSCMRQIVYEKQDEMNMHDEDSENSQRSQYV